MINKNKMRMFIIEETAIELLNKLFFEEDDVEIEVAREEYKRAIYVKKYINLLFEIDEDNLIIDIISFNDINLFFKDLFEEKLKSEIINNLKQYNLSLEILIKRGEVEGGKKDDW